MTNFSIYRKSTGTLKIPRISSGSMDIVRKTTGNFKIPMHQLASPPVFVSAEVGLIDAYTIDVLLSSALNESKIPDAADLIPAFSGGSTQIYDRTITGLHLYARTGIDSWYMPSKDELNLMYVNLHLYGVGNFDEIDPYMSSSEFSATTIWLQIFDGGDQSSDNPKASNSPIRAIRSFTSLKSYSLRDEGPAGGWIFYKDGNNYLECDITDYSGTAWSNITDVAIGTTSTAIGTGQANTTAIIGQSGFTAGAAKLCNDLVIGRAITAGEIGTIQYIPNALLAKKLTGLNGGLVAAFTESVTNNVSGATQPVLQTITVEDAAPTVFVLTYDIALDETSTPATTAFTIAGHTVASVLITGLTCKVTVTERVYWGDSDTLAYTKPLTNMIKSTTGGEADSFTAQAVTNNIAVPIILSDANAVFLYEFDDLTTITKDGSNLVSVWADKNLSGRNLLQEVGTKQPLWTSDGILLDGIDNFMKGIFTWDQPEVIFIVFKHLAYRVNGQLFDSPNVNKGTLRTPASQVLNVTTDFVKFSGNLVLLHDTWAIGRVVFNSASSKFLIGTTQATGTDFGTNSMGGLTLGAQGAGTARWVNMQVKGIIGRNLVSSEGDEIVMYNYLANKYSLPKI